MRTPRFGHDRASVVGAGSFGTAVAVLLVRAGLRTTLLCRTAEQAAALEEARENVQYLPAVELPERLKIRVLEGVEDQFDRPVRNIEKDVKRTQCRVRSIQRLNLKIERHLPEFLIRKRAQVKLRQHPVLIRLTRPQSR